MSASLFQRLLRPRYSLASFLILLTTLAIALGLWSASARRQAAAVAKLESFGIAVNYNGKLEDSSAPEWLREQLGIHYFLSVVGVRVNDYRVGRKMNPQPVEHIRQAVAAMRNLPHQKTIYFAHSGIEDAHLAELAPLANRIEEITFNEFHNSELTGAGLEHLAGWPVLRSVDFWVSDFDAQSLRFLRELPALKHVGVHGPLELASFKHLAACPRLETIRIAESRFDGRWLAELRRLPALQSVSLANCARNFTHPGPYTVSGDAMEAVEPSKVKFQFAPWSGDFIPQTLFPRIPDSTLDEYFDAWRDENLPGVEIYEFYSS